MKLVKKQNHNEYAATIKINKRIQIDLIIGEAGTTNDPEWYASIFINDGEVSHGTRKTLVRAKNLLSLMLLEMMVGFERAFNKNGDDDSYDVNIELEEEK